MAKQTFVNFAKALERLKLIILSLSKTPFSWASQAVMLQHSFLQMGPLHLYHATH